VAERCQDKRLSGFQSGIAIEKIYSSGATGGIAGVAGAAGADGLASGVATGAGALSVLDCNGSTDPAVSCGAVAGRLRGTGGRPGVTAADFVVAFGAARCGCGSTCGPAGGPSNSSSGGIAP
jgi:hypothetical protein